MLQCASISTKLGLVQFVDRGMMTSNEVREILSLPPIDGGDNVLLRKDTGVLSEETSNRKGGEEVNEENQDNRNDSKQ